VGDMGTGTWGGGHKQGHNERGVSVNWEVFRVVKDWSLTRIASPECPLAPLNTHSVTERGNGVGEMGVADGK
jgi:hypothetical protein